LVWQVEPVSQTAYIMSKKNDASYLFDNAEKDIWLMIYSKCTFDEMIVELNRKYDVLKEQLEKDVKAFLDDVLKEDLIYEIF